MGIKNLMNLIRENKVMETREIKTIENSRVGVDISIYIHKFGYGVVKEFFSNLSDDQLFSEKLSEYVENNRNVINQEICTRILNYFRKIENILFTFVFEGDQVESLKDHALQERMKNRERTKELLRIALEQKNRLSCINKLSALYSYSFSDIYEIMKNSHEDIPNIQIIRCPGESEQFICREIRSRRLDYILSIDTDVLAIGHDMIIDIGPSVYTIIKYNELLSKLGLDSRQFTDVCIMSGCDYNTNMKNIGVMKSLKLIKTYGSIDNLPDNYDISVLNHEECRRIFSLGNL
jgi:5'-3' exonuclease